MDNEQSASEYAFEDAMASALPLETGISSRYESLATREVTTAQLELRDGVLYAVYSVTNYSMVMSWPGPLIEQAMFFNIMPIVESAKLHEIVAVNPDTLNVLIADPVAVLATEWTGWANLVATVTYKTKKGDKKSRVERVVKLLEDFASKQAQLTSEQARLRTMQSASLVPHGETRELTFGSTVEISQQITKIAQIQRELEVEYTEITKQVALVNSAMKPVDTDWQTTLPPDVAELTVLNAPLPAKASEETEETED